MSQVMEAFIYGVLVATAGCALVVAFFCAAHADDPGEEAYDRASSVAIGTLTVVGLAAVLFLTYMMS